MKKRITVPGLTGHQVDTFSDKPPKLRFKPGQFVKWQNSAWEIIFCYRTKDEPNVWKFCLEESKAKHKINEVLEYYGCGELTPRIVYECFRDAMDANQYFSDIPANGDRMHVKTKELLNNAKVLSSGEIL